MLFHVRVDVQRPVVFFEVCTCMYYRQQVASEPGISASFVWEALCV